MGLSAWLGFDSSNSLELDLSDEGFHAVIIGATGSGKSQLLTSWLRSLTEGYQPDQLALALFDFKGGACLGPFAQLDQSIGLATDLDHNAPALLQVLSEQLVFRERLLAAQSVSRIQDLPPGLRPPTLLVVADEVVPLLALPNATQTLDSIASRGRSLGVHLIVTGQSLAGIPRNLMSNLGARFLVGKPDPVEMAQLGMGRLEGSAVAPVEGWASAIMATNRRQLRFTFSSAGKINQKNFFEPKIAQHAPNGNSAGSKSTDSAALPSNIYDFSSSFE
jgi:S-DNA-T family DNA segregation ATPase FtsK/SpoIIIE